MILKPLEIVGNPDNGPENGGESIFAFTRGVILFASEAMMESAKQSTGGLNPNEEVAVITTGHGTMVAAFWDDVAPRTVENFKKLARQSFYDGTAFHRIIKGFMIQGGDPNTKPGAGGTPGTGGPGYKIKAEFNNRRHIRGVLSMARSQHPDSAGSQFFICHGDATFLDGQYTAFGYLVSGDEVLEGIANAPVRRGGENSEPVERVRVDSIRIVKAPEAGC